MFVMMSHMWKLEYMGVKLESLREASPFPFSPLTLAKYKTSIWKLQWSCYFLVLWNIISKQYAWVLSVFLQFKLEICNEKDIKQCSFEVCNKRYPNFNIFMLDNSLFVLECFIGISNMSDPFQCCQRVSKH